MVGSAMAPAVSAAIDYNKQMEISRLGISAILTSMTTMKDAQGNVLSGADKWQQATRYTAQAQGELQKIAMTTAVTYQELVSAYQGILAPALAAKVSFKDTMELTGLMANSVKAMGLPMQQIVQESRDLVSGTIDQNAQLARSLGITNEDVKKWKEKGTIFEEIKNRLSGFVYASNEFSGTWEGAWSNFKDIAQRSLGEGLKPAFDKIKGELDKITERFVSIIRDSTGKIIDIQIKPEIMANLKNLALSFNEIVDKVKILADLLVNIGKPALFGAIAVGLGRIVLAIKEINLALLTTTRLTKASVIGLVLEGGLWGFNRTKDIREENRGAENVQRIYTNMGGKSDVSWLNSEAYRQIQEKTALTSEEMALALLRGSLSGGLEKVPAFKEYNFKWKFDDAAWSKSLQQVPDGSIEGNRLPDDKAQALKLQWDDKLSILRSAVARLNPELTELQKELDAINEKYQRLFNDKGAGARMDELKNLQSRELQAAKDRFSFKAAHQQRQADIKELESQNKEQLENLLYLMETPPQYLGTGVNKTRYGLFTDTKLSKGISISSSKVKLDWSAPNLPPPEYAPWQRFQKGWEDTAKKFAEVGSQMESMAQQIGQSLATAFGDFFFNVVTARFKSLVDTITNFLNAILRSITNVIGQQMANGVMESVKSWFIPAKASANGNVFAGGNPVPFASGGVVFRPTFFPMANGGTGLMGEAGPEAIMPLKRTADGKLGVAAAGGTAAPDMTVNIINQSGQSVKARSQGGASFDGRGYVKTIILEALDSDPGFRGAVRGY